MSTNQTKRQKDDKPGIQFTERMSGYFSKNADDYQAGYEQGKADGSAFAFVLTIRSDDVEKLLDERNHKAALTGTVQAPALSEDDLSVSQGKFNLFIEESEKDIRYMRYRMILQAEEGLGYYFTGFKKIHDEPGFDVWEDTTTLFITIYDGESEQAPVWGKGILKINLDDFRKQITTMEVTGVSRNTDKLKYQVRFLKFFGENIKDIYL